jgi:hypothetical protein
LIIYHNWTLALHCACSWYIFNLHHSTVLEIYYT